MKNTTTFNGEGPTGAIRSAAGVVQGLLSAMSQRMGGFLFGAGLLGGLAAAWIGFPALLYEKVEQPISFSHQTHTSEKSGQSCDDCHGFREDGSFVGIPPTSACVDCHEEPQGESQDERILIEKYIKTKTEIPWLVYARQPDNVAFSHAAHVKLAEIECQRCHGDHGKTDRLRPFERNRISTYSRDIWGQHIQGGGPFPWSSMKMDDCAGCHKDHGVQDSCLTCHR